MIGPYLTFNLQVDMVLLDPQVVSSNAGVLSAIQRLGHVDLQCTILMDYIRVAALNAGLTVFEPARQQQMMTGLVFNGVVLRNHLKNDEASKTLYVICILIKPDKSFL